MKNNYGKKVIAIWLTGFLSLFSIASFVVMLLRNNYSVSTYTNLITLAATFAIYFLILRKNYTTAFIVGLSAAFFQVGIMQVLDRAGISFHMSVMLIIIGVGYAVLLLPEKNISKGILATVVLGIIPNCIDYWGPATRSFADNTTEKIMMTFVMVLAGAIIFLVFRLWKDFDLSTKMVIAMLATTMIVITFLQVFIIFTHVGFAQQLEALSNETGAIEKMVWENNQGLTLLGSFGMTFASLLGLSLAYVIASPLRYMVIEVDEVVKTGNMNKNIKTDSQDEIGQLGQALQRLLEYFKDRASTAIRLSEGDLREKIQPLSDVDTLGIAYKTMLANLNSALSQVVESASSLDTASNQLEETAEMSDKATTQIAETIQQVARGITQETESVTQTSQSVELMAKAIEGVARGATDQSKAVNETSQVAIRINSDIEKVIQGIEVVTENSTNAERTAVAGSQIVQTNLDGMSSIKTQVSLSTQKVEEMGTLSQNIGIILETISEIAEQTNLLALNAAIEAARAGDSGKGFAVVADEVRKLAERSSSSTKEIANLVSNIQRTVDEAVTAMHASTKEVDRGVKYSTSASRALHEIMESVKRVNEQAEKVSSTAISMRSASDELTNSVDRVSAVVIENSAATEEMTAGSRTVLNAIENISSVSEENSAAVEEVSASTEEISAQSREVADLAHSAAAIAKSLNEAVTMFQLRETKA